MLRYQAKICSIVGLLVIPFIFTIMPIKLSDYIAKKGEKGKKMLSCLMCFGGGVFFAVFMLHMAPEARAIIDVSLERPYNIKYPISDLLMSFGFFMIMFLEMGVTVWSTNSAGKKNKLAKLSNSKQNHHHDDREIGPGGDSIPPNSTSTFLLKENESESKKNESLEVFADQKNANQHGHSHGIDDCDFNARSMVLMFALSLHRIFEGMSCGLQNTTTNVWNLFIAIICHESIIGFSLGLQLVKNKFSIKRIILLTLLCSIFEPCGAAIGTLITELGETSSILNIINGVLQSIATGTFIYITFFEILQQEITPGTKGNLDKLLSVIFGFIVMAAFCAIPEESIIMKALPTCVNRTNTTTSL